jgi:two-component system sensor histidine kinase CreC
MDFTREGGLIRVSAGPGEIVVFNEAEPVPEYALARLTERFYSLPRPATGRKSTGLGLNFVEEVLHLHGGSLQVRNVLGGVMVTLKLPAARLA